MRLLVLGGTQFVGHAIVSAALGLGWEVTTFNRGMSGADVTGVRALRGDRAQTADLATLSAAGPWDAAIDSSGYGCHGQKAAAIAAAEARVRLCEDAIEILVPLEARLRHALARIRAVPSDLGETYKSVYSLTAGAGSCRTRAGGSRERERDQTPIPPRGHGCRVKYGYHPEASRPGREGGRQCLRLTGFQASSAT